MRARHLTRRETALFPEGRERGPRTVNETQERVLAEDHRSWELKLTLIAPVLVPGFSASDLLIRFYT